MEERENEYWEQQPQPVLPAPLHKRFVNWIVDTISTGFLVTLLLSVLKGAYPPIWESFTKDPYSWKNSMTIQFLYAVVLSIQEGFFRGKTLAKSITRTRAVLADGSQLPTETAFLRSLIRLIPFEPLTTFLLGRPLHDVWSGSVVVNDDMGQPS